MNRFGRALCLMVSRIAPWLMLICAPGLGRAESSCEPVSAAKQAEIRGYLRSRYSLLKTSIVEILDVSDLEPSCYHKISVKFSRPDRRVSYYLSADQLYLIPVLMDLRKDPGLERRQLAHMVGESLAADSSPESGPINSRVVLVEFSDFECPFCKRFSSLFQALPEEKKSKVNLVFKYLPLEMHPWATRAAELSACANQQAPLMFWKVHDFLFANQGRIRNDNFDDFVEMFLKSADVPIDAPLLRTCMSSHGTLELVKRDKALAQSLNVEGTPTVFLNGSRLSPVKSTRELELLIDQAFDLLTNKTTRDSLPN